MNLYLDLLRHGETQLSGFRGSLDDALTERGWQQMREAVSEQSGWQRIISSPLQRCRLFAEWLAAERQLPLHLEANLRELHFGDWEGRTAAELMEIDSEALGQFWADPYRFGPPNGEPLSDFSQRIQQALQQLSHYYAGERLLVITHGGVMRYVLAQARGLPKEQLLQVAVPHAALFRLHMTASHRHEEPLCKHC